MALGPNAMDPLTLCTGPWPSNTSSPISPLTGKLEPHWAKSPKWLRFLIKIVWCLHISISTSYAQLRYILAWTCAYPCTECHGTDEEATLESRSLVRWLATCISSRILDYYLQRLRLLGRVGWSWLLFPVWDPVPHRQPPHHCFGLVTHLQQLVT